jgi:purine nucleosidase
MSLCCLATVHAATPRRPLIIRTDPGIDASIAMLLAAASPEVDLRAVCINFGSLHNVSQLARNALAVLEIAGRGDVPVYVGAVDPLAAPFHDLGGPLFHGEDGLGGAPRPAVHHGVDVTKTVPEAIVEACRTWNPKPVLASLAPLTNIAVALALEPNLPVLCPDLFLMGGAVAVAGNTSPLAEANLANDAEAAAKVFAAGFNTRIAGLDVTMATWLDTAFLETFRSMPNLAGPFIWNITRFYSKAYGEYGFLNGMPLHDLSVILMVLKPSLYTMRRWPATIDTSSFPSAARGMVIADRRGGPLSPPPPANVT